MTDTISARLRAAQADDCCNDIKSDEAADHIDAQADRIAVLVEALELADAVFSGANMNMRVVEKKARAALAAAKEPT